MKKIFLIFVVILMPFCAVHAEEIVDFSANIQINPDASIAVTETITYDFGTAQKHGLYRDIPVVYKNAIGDNRTVKIDDVSVVDQSGMAYDFALSRENTDLRIKIGDAQKFVTGQKTYMVTYTVYGAMNYFDDHDELYWNVTGDRWVVPMTSVYATVKAPSDIIKKDCFVGIYGSTRTCDVQNSDGQSAAFSQSVLLPGEGMTIVIGVPHGTVYKPTIGQKIVQYLIDNWIICLPILVFFGMWRLWYVKGRDPVGRGTIVPFYEAPDGMTPMEMGMILKDAVVPQSISAAIIQLAIDGYITIKKIDKKGVFSSDDYEFVKTDKDASQMNEQNTLLYDAIFDGVSSRMLLALKEKFYKDLEKIKKSVERSNMQKGYYVKNPTTVRALYITTGILMLFGSFFAGGVLGFMYGLAGVLSAISVMGFGIIMPQRTQKGSIVREEVIGLKMYMETAEKDRINFHNAPEKRPERFEKLLPYAMVLGVEEKWAEQFKDIYKTKPEWYQSNDPAFSSMAFAHGLHAFSDVNTSVMTSKPSSAGSGGSGFSGGGSGGGFGGGGGGSW